MNTLWQLLEELAADAEALKLPDAPTVPAFGSVAVVPDARAIKTLSADALPLPALRLSPGDAAPANEARDLVRTALHIAVISPAIADATGERTLLGTATTTPVPDVGHLRLVAMIASSVESFAADFPAHALCIRSTATPSPLAERNQPPAAWVTLLTCSALVAAADVTP